MHRGGTPVRAHFGQALPRGALLGPCLKLTPLWLLLGLEPEPSLERPAGRAQPQAGRPGGPQSCLCWAGRRELVLAPQLWLHRLAPELWPLLLAQQSCCLQAQRLLLMWCTARHLGTTRCRLCVARVSIGAWQTLCQVQYWSSADAPVQRPQVLAQ